MTRRSPPLELRLASPAQEAHVERLTNILRSSPFALDLSKLGAGKTFTAAYTAGHLGMRDVVVVCPVSVKPKWTSMKTAYGVPISRIMSYCELRSPTFARKAGLLNHRTVAVPRKCRRDQRTYFLNRSEYEATPEWVSRVRRGGTLVILDEIQNLKNKSSQFWSAKALLAPVVADREEGGRAAPPSKALLMSGTPLDKQEQAVNLFRTVGVMRSNELAVYNPGTGLLLQTGMAEIRDYCARLPGAFAAVPVRPISVFQMFDKVVKPHLASSMPAPPCTAVIHKYNATYDANDERQKSLIVRAIDDLSRACNYDARTRSVDLTREPMGRIATALMRVEEAKLPTFVRVADDHLTNSTFQKVVLGVHYCGSIEVLRRQLARWDPLVMTGSLKASQRQRVLSEFQKADTERRLLICNISVCSAGIDLDDKQGRFRRLVLANPNYANITLYQFGQRFLRADTRSDATLHYVFLRDNCEEQVLRALARKSDVMKIVAGAPQGNTASRAHDHDVLYPGEYPAWDEAGTEEKRDRAAMRIQKTWRAIVGDPRHPVCRRRLMREFEGMDDEFA